MVCCLVMLKSLKSNRSVVLKTSERICSLIQLKSLHERSLKYLKCNLNISAQRIPKRGLHNTLTNLKVLIDVERFGVRFQVTDLMLFDGR